MNFKAYWEAQRIVENFDYIEIKLGIEDRHNPDKIYSCNSFDKNLKLDLTANEMAIITIYADGYNLSEISEILGKSYSSVRRLYHNALQKIRGRSGERLANRAPMQSHESIPARVKIFC